jgi:hypothetical protein
VKLDKTRRMALVFVCLSLSVSGIAAPKEPQQLKPSSPWYSDYQPEGCRLVRRFGEGKDLVTLQMSRFAPTEYFNMTLSGENFDFSSNRTVSIQFGPSEAEQKIEFVPGKVAKVPSILSLSEIRIAPIPPDILVDLKNVDPPDIVKMNPLGEEREKAVKFLKIGRPLRKAVILEIGSMNKPLAALSKCITDLITSWGLDAERHKNMIRPAMPSNNPGNWLNSSDYPSKMLEAGQPAIVEFRLEVDEAGKATQCHIQQTTRAKEFDDAVCRGILKRAKFTPALDADAKPLRTYYQNTVRFQPFG